MAGGKTGEAEILDGYYSEKPLVNPSLVTRCVCTNTLLLTLTGYSSIVEVKDKTRCGRYCGLCLPYIKSILSCKK